MAGFRSSGVFFPSSCIWKFRPEMSKSTFIFSFPSSSFLVLSSSDRWRATETPTSGIVLPCLLLLLLLLLLLPLFFPHIWHFRWALKKGVIASSIQIQWFWLCLLLIYNLKLSHWNDLVVRFIFMALTVPFIINPFLIYSVLIVSSSVE